MIFCCFEQALITRLFEFDILILKYTHSLFYLSKVLKDYTLDEFILFRAYLNDYLAVSIKVLRDLFNTLRLIETNSDDIKVHAQERIIF